MITGALFKPINHRVASRSWHGMEITNQIIPVIRYLDAV